MNVLIITYGDWSGAGYATMEAINETTDHDCRIITFPHIGNYTEYKTDIFDPDGDEIRKMWKWADVVNFHDGYGEYNIPIDCDQKPIVETYHGTWYRRDPGRFNKKAAFRGRKQTCFNQNLSTNGPKWIGRPIKDISDMWNPSIDSFIVSHCTTEYKLKGTKSVIDAAKNVECVELDLIVGVTNEECLERKAMSRLMIDEGFDGLGLGYGTNSLEAWSLGIPVISVASEKSREEIMDLVGYIPFAEPDGTLEELILRFYNDEEFYNKWADIGKKFVNELHSQEFVANQMIGVFKEAIDDFTPIQKKAKISVCMIIKNESGKILNAISSCRGLADEVSIADTGSTDTSVDLCKKVGCVVSEGADCMNKAESRNKAINDASGDWIVILDADEEITDPFLLRENIEKMEREGVEGAYIMEGCSMGPGGEPTEVFNQMRVWKKGTYEYKYRAHELPTLKGKNSSILNIPVLFAHYQDRSPEHMTWKLQYTLDRLLLDVKDYPDGGRPKYYLGRQYMYMKDYNNAIKMLEEFLEMTKATEHWERPNACMDLYKCYSDLGLEKDGMRWLYNACLENPMNRKWWYILANAYYKKGQYNIAVGLLSTMFAIPSESQSGYKSMVYDGQAPFDLMARAFWKLGMYEAGKISAEKALKMEPNNERLRNNLKYFVDKLADG